MTDRSRSRWLDPARLLSPLAVFLGGALGTLLRLLVDAAAPHEAGGFPTSTLIVNVLGSFALGYLVAYLWPTVSTLLKAFLGTGLLGGFTTFSAVVLSLISLAQVGEFWVAAVYLAVTLVLGFAAAAGGLVLGARRGGGASASPGAPLDVDE